ncbi:terminase large subunit [Lysobacter capsici]|nr:terminase large subunit [Lysobacter capsici]
MVQKRELVALLEERDRRKRTNRLRDYVPYAKQALWHALGCEKRERMLSAGNQLGKTLAASGEVAIHLTGRYPDNWEGLRFNRGNSWLAGSESGELTRRGVQRLLFGDDARKNAGTGMIPQDAIISISWSRHVNDLIDTAKIRHASGEVSRISLKSYDQGRGKWQADTVDGIWFDEEPPEDIYLEGLTRTNVTFGPILVTCTLLKGMTAIASRFWRERDQYPDVGMVNMTIHDVDHYSAEQKAKIIASYPAHEREARTMGTPSLGSGRIFPVSDESIKVDSFAIPAHWPQIGGLDFGWDHPFGAVKIAWDRDSDCIYVTNTYREREATPVTHAAALRPWGSWLPWAWPHDGLQHDKGSGEELAKQYRDQQLNMLDERATFEDGGNGVEAGVIDMLDRMQTGRLKVFAHLADWFDEFRLYHRDKGRIVKLNDDLLSATRYAIMMLRFAALNQTARALNFKSEFSR